MGKTNIGFIIEQALGHITHGQNLMANAAHDPDIAPFWGLPQFELSGWAAQLPVYKSNWTVRASLQARRMVAQMQRQQPLDALFFHTQVTAVLAQNWLHKIPSIISLDATPRQYDSLGEFYQHASGPDWLEQKKWQLNRNAFRAARHIVAWTEWTRDGVVDEYDVPFEKVTVIPPGVNSAEWQRPTPRQRHSNPAKILFVGGDLARKGGLDLLQAFRALRQEGPVELHLVTRNPVEAEPGLFVYNTMQPNSAALKQLYFDCDIFCLPTYGDCLPMVLSEAGAAGLPLVSTAVAGIPEIVQEGRNGYLVPAGDVAALVHALRPLVQQPDLRLRLGETAVHITTNRFDAKQNALRLFDLLKTIASQPENAQQPLTINH
ncbi:MAG: glycosyltransferase family 4 protein [Candidatus Promineifilaceae bacterium]